MIVSILLRSKDLPAAPLFLSRWCATFLFVGLLGAAPAWSQTATVRVQENVRASPNGTVLGQVASGAQFRIVGRDGRWLEISVEGWMWARSLQTRTGAFDLTVSESDGENLRAEPQGAILGRLGRGTFLNEVERVPGWALVQRSVWIWAESMDEDRAEATAAPETAPGPGASAPLPQRWLRGGERGAVLFSDPDGDTLAIAGPGTEVRVLRSEGRWARVRLDAWVWVPSMEEEMPDDTLGFARVTPTDVSREPDRYRGRIVAWDLQAISLERAERVRTDFYEGEPFLLTRTPDGSSGFVYVAIPQERLAEVEGLTPLEEISVVGRVRTGSASVTGSPIVDLLELRRAGRNNPPDGS